MIEFKAECGHTVRAKDEDAGKVVRCAYCGREAQVPQDDQDELDFLFSEVDDKGGEVATVKPKGGRRGGDRGASLYGGGVTRVDPFGLVKRMSYVAAILVCVIFVGKKYAWPMFEEAFLQDAPDEQRPPVTVSKPTRPTSKRTPPPSSHRFGLLTTRLDKLGKEGVYVNPVPTRATVYYCRNSDKTTGFDWISRTDTERIDVRTPKDLDVGRYVIVAMVPINDRELKQRYRAFDYDELRRAVEDNPRRADEAAKDYFRPDEATDVKIVAMGGRTNIARRYEVTVERDAWTVLTPQFLPYNCPMKDLVQFLAKTRAYGFDEAELESDFDFYGVNEADHGYMIDILRRIGTISYRLENQSFRMFKIDPVDGMISAPHLKGVHRAPPVTGRP